MRILVVEDYSPVRKALTKGLTEAAFAVDATDNGQDGLWYAQHNEYDVIVLDLMLPKMDGLSLMRQLRADGCAAGILLLTARDSVDDRVEGLNSGADDYLTKPFAFKELLARVQVLLRRRYRQAAPKLIVGTLEIDTATQQVVRGGENIQLTRREYSLLHYLAVRQGETISRAEIWQNLYEFNSDAHSNVVDVYIRYLRNKIERTDWPPLIHTRRGFGYCLSQQAEKQ